MFRWLFGDGQKTKPAPKPQRKPARFPSAKRQPEWSDDDFRWALLAHSFEHRVYGACRRHDDLLEMREDAEDGLLTHRDLYHGIERFNRDTGEEALVSVADVDREIKDSERWARDSARLAARCALQVVGRDTPPRRLKASLREELWGAVKDHHEREIRRKRGSRFPDTWITWATRHVDVISPFTRSL